MFLRLMVLQFLFLTISDAFLFFKKKEVKVSYDGYQIYRIYEVNRDTEQYLSENDRNHLRRRKDLGLPSYIDVLVRPDEWGRCSIPACTVRIDDVGALARNSYASRRADESSVEKLKSNNWAGFYRYEDILDYLFYLEKNSSDVNTEVIGKTFHGRPLVVLKVSGSNSSFKKKTIFLDGGIHAREWLSPASVLYVIKELVESRSNKELLNRFEWHFLPVFNPDGYEYSHTTDRLWRKNRSKHPSSRCLGVDLNRNFDFEWGKYATSQKPCSDMYGGRKPFSESETKAVSSYLAKIQNLKAYVSTHNYGNYILIPFGSDKRRPENDQELHETAKAAAEAMRAVGGTKFVFGRTAELLYPVSGGASDWVKEALNATYSYSIELRGRDSSGFLSTIDEIIPSGKELFMALRAIANRLS